jgi:hypothetical protein
MLLNQPMTSSSHWRIPKTAATRQDTRVSLLTSVRRRALDDALPQIGAQSLVATRSLWRAIVAGLLIGGVVVAPMLVVVALVGLLASPPLAAHQVASALIVASLLWLALAIFGAHAQVGSPVVSPGDADEDGPSRD